MGALLNYKMIYTMPADFEDKLIASLSVMLVKKQTISPKWEGDSTKHPYASFIYPFVIVGVNNHFVTKVYRVFTPDIFSLKLWYVDFVNKDETVDTYFRQGGPGSNIYLSNDDAAEVIFKQIVNKVFQEYFYGGGGWAPTNDTAAAKAVNVVNMQNASSTGDLAKYQDDNLITYIPDKDGNKIIPTKNGVPIYQTPVQNPPEMCTGYPVPVKTEPPPAPKPITTRNQAKPVPKPVAKPTPTRNQAKPIPPIKGTRRR